VARGTQKSRHAPQDIGIARKLTKASRAYGFKTELLVELVNAGLATATIEHMAVGRRRVKVIRMRITAAGRRALAKLRWP